MAKYTVTHICGHAVQHDLVGKESERQSRIKWLAETDCRACWQAEQARLVDERAASLPQLEGSERQVAWAKTLRNKLIDIIDQEETSLVAAAKAEWVSEIVRETAAKMRRQTKASYWIDHRDDMLGRLRKLVTEKLAKRQG